MSPKRSGSRPRNASGLSPGASAAEASARIGSSMGGTFGFSVDYSSLADLGAFTAGARASAAAGD